MLEFIDLTDATCNLPICVRPMEIRMLCATSIGTQVHVSNFMLTVRESIDEIKEMCKKAKCF